MEFGGEKSLHDLIEERHMGDGGPFPASNILKVAVNMARGLKVTVAPTSAGLVLSSWVGIAVRFSHWSHPAQGTIFIYFLDFEQ